MENVGKRCRSGALAIGIAFSVVWSVPSAFARQGDSSGHCCGKLSHLGYGAVGLQVQKNQSRVMGNVCFSGVYIISRHFGLGGGGATSLAPVNIALNTSTGVRVEKIQFGYGGIIPEFRLGMSRTVGVLVNTLVGAGGYNSASESKTSGGGFFVIEPRVSASVRLHTFLRVNIGVAYRHIDGFDAVGFEGMSTFCQLLFGLF